MGIKCNNKVVQYSIKLYYSKILAAILRCLNFRLLFFIVIVGSPQAPWDLTYSDVTENSVRLHWKSGYDMGSRQHFVIYRVFNDIARKVRLDSNGMEGKPM